MVARMDGRWVTAEALQNGKEAPQSLVLGVARQMDSEALAHGEAFATALAFIKVVLSGEVAGGCLGLCSCTLFT